MCSQFLGMRTRFAVAAHLSADELAVRYRAAGDAVERGHWQMVWLLILGRPLTAVTGYSTRWVREVVRRYNERGPEGLGDGRHANPGADPLLDAAGQDALKTALAQPPPEGGLWTSVKVSRWIADRTGRAHVAVQRGWDYLQRIGYSRQVPRSRHERAADAGAKAGFEKS